MLKDDRMMSMLTFAVIMIAVGTLLQRVDVLDLLLGRGGVALEFKRDEAIVRANVLSGIDVLANDLGLREGDARNLIIAEQPKCGRVFVRDGQAHYLPAERCAGSQSFKYALSGRGRGQTGEVIVVVRLGDPTQSEVAADAQRDIPAPAPIAPRAAEQRVAEAPALLAAQPPAGADTGGAIVPMSIPMPTVPRPSAPAIAGLPDTAPAPGAAAAGVTFGDSGLAPRMAAPAGALAEAPKTAAVPVVPQPDPQAPAASAPVAPQPAQPALARLAGQTPAPTAPEAPPAGVRAPRLVVGSPAPLPAGSAAGGGGSTGSDTGSGGETPATIALARVERIDRIDRIEPVPQETGAAAGPRVERENDGLDANVPRSGPPEIGSGGASPADFGQPAEALAGVRRIGDAAALAPIDTTPPAPLSDPGVIAGAGARQTGERQTGEQQPQSPATSATSATPATPATSATLATPATSAASDARVAALPSPATPCTVPPALTLEVRPAGLTEVIIDSICHAGTVAELSYDGLRFGVALDDAGAGALTAAGFQQAGDAVLRFAGGATKTFNIAFSDTERMTRVALVWEQPIDLDLNAFEFGALPGSAGHVDPDQPRSHGDVRRGGGGYLLEYRPVGGVGQSIGIYTYWHRYGGRSGVVRLGVDFASRNGGQRPDTCGGGALAEPDFMVLRSVAGQLERPRQRRLASLDCTAVAGTADRFIGDAIDDMIVLKR